MPTQKTPSVGILFAFFYLWTTSVWAEQFSFQPSPISNNLTQSSVRDIFQDQDGFIWLLTQEGLNRYDGISVINYRPSGTKPYAISHQAVTSILQDHQGTIWVATAGGGLNRYEKSKDGFSTPSINQDLPAILRTAHLHSSGAIWLSANERSDVYLAMFHPDSPDLVVQYKSPTSTLIEAITDFHGGGLLLGLKGDTGLALFNEASDQKYTPITLVDTDGRKLDKVRTEQILHVAEHEYLIATSTHGALLVTLKSVTSNKKVTPAAKILRVITPLETFAILRTEEPDKFIFGTREGMMMLNSALTDTSVFNTDNSELPDNQILSLLQDNSGMIWVGTFNGVAKGKKTIFELISTSNASGSVQINSLEYTERNRLYIGTSKGLLEYEPETGALSAPTWLAQQPDLANSAVMTLFNQEDYLWMGTLNSGLYRYDKFANRVEKVSSSTPDVDFNNVGITDIHADDDALVFATWGFGIYRLGQDSTVAEPLFDESVVGANNLLFTISIAQGSNRVLWFGTERGLYRHIKGARYLQNIGGVIGTAGNLLSAVPWYLHFSKDGNLWIGSQSGALSYIPSSSLGAARPTVINLADQLSFPSYDIYAVSDDNTGNIWISHNRGISKIARDLSKIYNFLPIHGLQGAEFNHATIAKSPSGTLVFGGNQGFNMIDPDNAFEETYASSFVFTSIMTDGTRSYPDYDESRAISLTLPASAADLKLEFSSLDYLNPLNISYRYRINATDEDWIDLGSTPALTLPTLPSGDHFIEFQATNSYGEWSSEIITAVVSVAPPLYLTPMAYILYCTALVSSLLLMRLRSKRRWANAALQRKELRQEVEKRTVELRQAIQLAEAANTAKTQFITTISHEIRTPLHGILGINELLERTVLDGEQRNYVQSIKYSGEKLLLILSDILDFSKLEAGRVDLQESTFIPIDLVEETVFLYQGFADKRGNTLTADWLPNCDQKLICDQQKLRQILGNLVSNSLKFTLDGAVHIRIRLEQGVHEQRPMLVLSVTDTGAGVKREELSGITKAFTQANNSQFQDSALSGTGLGLSIVEKYIRLLNGTLTLQSKFGWGTKALIRLPVTLSEASESVQHLPRSISLLNNRNNREARMVLLQLSRIYQTAQSISRQIPPETNATATINEEARRHKLLITHANDDANDHTITLPTTTQLLRSTLTASISPNRDRNSEPMSTYASLSVLVVEDIETNIQILGSILSKLGCRYEVALNGQLALDKCRRDHYDLIFMDCQMPIMDGFEATREIRQLNLSRPPVIMAVTAGTSSDEQAICLEAGMNGVIAKPFSHQTIQQQLDYVLSDNTKITKVEVVTEANDDVNHTTVNQILALFDNDSSKIERLFETFYLNCERAVEDANNALTRHNQDSLRQIAHSVKSAALNIGASKIAALAEQMERGADDATTRTLLTGITKENQSFFDYARTLYVATP